jgi:putative transposase
MKFAFIKRHREIWPVTVMCRVLQVSRSGFFGWQRRPVSRRDRRQRELIEKIKVVYQENRRLYGSPRVHRALQVEGQRVSRNTVAKLMRRPESE